MLRWSTLVACTVIAACGVYGGWKLLRRATLVDLSAPPALGLSLCREEDKRADRFLAIALGDSLTRGNMSYNYLDDARVQLGDSVLILNAGVNGDSLSDMANRLDPIIACQPDFVSIMAGTNDALKARPVRGDQSPRSTEYWQTEAALLDAIILRLQRETDGAIAVFTLPMAGEEPSGGLNARLAPLSKALSEQAASRGAAILPLRDVHTEMLAARPATAGSPPCDTKADTLAPMAGVVARAKRRGATADYDAMATAAGHYLVVDCVHLSETGGRPASALLAQAISETLAGREERTRSNR